MLNDRHLKLLESRGLDAETLARHGVRSSAERGGDWIEIPYLQNGVEVNAKARTIAGEKEMAQKKGGAQIFWNVDVLTDQSLAELPLVITEGEFDALAAIQCGFPRTISVPNGAPAEAVGDDDSGAKYAYVREAKKLLEGAREIILAVDGDDKGVNLLNDLAIRLGKARCKWVKYPKGCKDLNDALKAFGEKGVAETLRRAQWMKVDGIYRMSELPPVPNFEPHEIGLPGMEAHYNVRMGDLCIVTGIPSHGKSSAVNDICCRLVERYRWTVAFASFEQHPQIDHRRNLRRWHARKPTANMTLDEKRAADAWIDRYFSFLVPSEDDDVTLAWTLERCAAAVIQHDAKVVVIDPWNEMDHVRAPDMSLTEYTGFAIKQFKKFARKHQVHVIVVAHPAKQKKNDDGTFQIPTLYDISDSAHWYNKADVGIVVHRKTEQESVIRVAKSRYHEIIGKPGDESYHFNSYMGRYEWMDGYKQMAAE